MLRNTGKYILEEWMRAYGEHLQNTSLLLVPEVFKYHGCHSNGLRSYYSKDMVWQANYNFRRSPTRYITAPEWYEMCLNILRREV